jgi:hypothetical protein
LIFRRVPRTNRVTAVNGWPMGSSWRMRIRPKSGYCGGPVQRDTAAEPERLFSAHVPVPPGGQSDCG